MEARISISSARSQELQSVILGRFGLQSIKEPANGYLVPIPSLNDSRRKFSAATPSDSVGDGCDTFKNFKLLSWRPRSKRKRGKSSLIARTSRLTGPSGPLTLGTLKQQVFEKIKINILVRRNKWIGVVKRGGCSFATKIQLATRLGAKSLVIIDNTDDSTPVMMNTIGN